jgi:hypothetical protein
MGFMGLKGFGHKDSVNDFTDVLVPIANAKRHPNVIAEYQRRNSKEGARPDATVVIDPKDESTGDSEGGLPRTTSSVYSPYTIEGIKAEINDDLGATAVDTAYDCKNP